MRACERLRVLLSQLPTASVTVENMSDSGDVNVSFTRDELARTCSKQLQGLRSLLETCLEGVSGSEDGLAAVEISGGGMRMTMVQELVTSIIGNVRAP
jgi:molecular chaperone DnaK (HSP70)